ncbi:nitroreductase [Ottowia sp. VDI28]|uniref:nitroreductase n=1 Tax=Ottowia sp. VDI28 TaxID=3133968 RepID=UPI003C2D2EC3
MSSDTSQLNAPIADQASVDAAIENRFCVRAFLPTPVPREMIQDILRVATRAPSGSNAQPWKVYVLQGDAKAGLSEKVCAAHDALREHTELEARFRPDYDYYPRHWVEPYLARRRQCGWGLYGLLGIAKGDGDRMHAQHQRNYRFFDAPVGMMFTLDRVMGQGSLVDYGMFLQNIMVAARARGLHTCPQAAWNNYAHIVLPHIGASAEEMLVCGLSLGHADTSAKVNTYSTPREPVESFTHWLS